MKRVVLGKHQVAILKLLSSNSGYSICIDYIKNELSLSRSYVLRTCFMLWKYDMCYLVQGLRAEVSYNGISEIDKRTGT